MNMKRVISRLPSYFKNILNRRYCTVETTEKFFVEQYKRHTPLALVPISQYGGEVVVSLLYGDSLIGTQGSMYIEGLVSKTKVPISFEKILITNSRLKEQPEDLYAVLRNRTAIVVDLELDISEREKRIEYLQQFDLHTCIVKFKSHTSMGAKMSDVDVWMYGQNNIGNYMKLEYEPSAGIVETLEVTAESTLIQYLTFVFNHAQKYGRKKITLGHQAHYFPTSEGMFRDIAYALHADHYKSLELSDMCINDLALNILEKPQQFDVICTLSRYGDMISALLSGICGGAGLFSAIDIGEHFAMFKPLQTKLSLSECHSLSPYGIVNACVDLLEYLDKCEMANIISEELEYVMCKGVKTEEYGGNNSSDFVICSIANNLQARFGHLHNVPK